MQYDKPEIVVLTAAISSIQATKDDIVTDSSLDARDPSVTAAYADWE